MIQWVFLFSLKIIFVFIIFLWIKANNQLRWDIILKAAFVYSYTEVKYSLIGAFGNCTGAINRKWSGCFATKDGVELFRFLFELKKFRLVKLIDLLRILWNIELVVLTVLFFLFRGVCSSAIASKNLFAKQIESLSKLLNQNIIFSFTGQLVIG